MADYYIPLSTLLPFLPDLPILAGIPGWDTVITKVGVRDLRERWNDGYQVTTGHAVIDADTTISFFGMKLLFGLGDGDQTELEFEYAADRSTILETLVDKIFEETEVPASVELLEGNPDASVQVQFLQANGVGEADSALLHAPGPTKAFRLVLRGLGARLRLPTDHVQLGVHELQGQTIVGVKAAPGDLPVDIALPSFTLVVDSVRGVELQLDHDQALDCPPFIIKDLGIGFEVDQVKVDLSKDSGFAEVTARPGFDQTWCGVYIGAARVFNLDELLPFLPDKIEVSKFLIDGEGTTGVFEAVWAEEDDPEPDGLWRLGSFALEWERGAIVRGTALVTLRVGGLGNEWAGIGPDGDLELSTTLRQDPSLSGLEAIGWDFSVRAPGVDDKGLMYLGKETLELVVGGAIVALLVAAAVEQDADLGFAALGLFVAGFLQAAGALVLERFILDGFGMRVYHRQLGGHLVQFVDLVLDVQVLLSLDLGLGLGVLPHLKTNKPIGVSVRGLVVQIAVDPPEALDIPKVDFLLDHESGVSFDVDEETLIDLGFVVRVTKAALGRWEEGLWVELGLEMDEATIDVGFSISSLRLWFRNDGSLAKVTPGDVGFSLLVPGALYAKGQVELGDVTRVEARGFLVQAVPPATPDAVFKRESYVWNVGVGLRLEDLDGVDSVVVSADLEWSTGVPISFCPAVSWYGINALVAVNAQPDTGGQSLAHWFLEKAPKNQITVGKFEGAVDAWGIGVGAVFGSTGGSATFFSVKAGIMLQFPGPVLMITGTGNVLSPRPAMGDSSSGAFAAIVVIDFSDDGYVSLDVRLDYKVPASGSLLSLTVPIEFLAGWGGQGFHLYLGRDKPKDRRIRVKVLSIFDLSGYLMLDCADIDNLAETGVDVPGFAIALGGRAEWEWGLKARFLKIYFYLRVELNLALSLPDPVLFFAGVLLEGGLVVKVFGFGFEFGVHVDANLLARNPWRLWGSFRITIGLPWPLPDIKISVPFSLGDDEVPLPEPPMAVAGLTLMHRGSNEPQKLEVGGHLGDAVQLDPVLALSFVFPMRNATGVVGTFALDATNTQTWWLAAGDEASGVKGYRFELTNLRLQRRVGNQWVDGPLASPGSWTPRGGVKAKGGQELRDELTLMDWRGPLSARIMGTSASYWDSLLDEWDPCPEAVKPRALCVDFDDSALGAFPPGRLLHAAPEVWAEAQERDESAVLLCDLLGLDLHPGAVEEAPMVLPALPEVAQALRLPMASVHAEAAAMVGALLTNSPEVDLLPGVVLRFPRTRKVQVDLLVPTTTHLRVRFTLEGAVLGEPVEAQVVEVLSTGSGGGVGVEARATLTTSGQPGWRHLRYSCSELCDGVVIEAAALEGKRSQVWPAWLYRACLVPEAAVVAFEEARSTAKAWKHFWANLLDQQASTSDALLLEPDSDYRLVVDYSWATLEGDANTEVHAGADSAAFHFRTTDEAPTSLRPRARSVGGGEDDWDLDTVPADGSFAVYTERPLGMLFADPRTEALFARFGRRLVLRFIDEDGQDLFERLEILEAEATEQPEYMQSWWEFVTNLDCTPEGATDLVGAGVAHFASVLARETWYDALVVSVPDPNGTLDLSALPAGWSWEAHPVLHSFRFRTSRYGSLQEHLADYTVIDELCDAPPDLAAVAAAAGQISGTVTDDQALDAVVAALKLPPRPPPWRAPPDPSSPGAPPRPPELTRVWRELAPGSYEVVALLLDSPEPLGSDGVELVLERQGLALATLQVRGLSGARSVLMRRVGQQLGTLPAGSWSLQVSDEFWDVTGTLSTQTLARPLTVPALPDAFGPEED